MPALNIPPVPTRGFLRCRTATPPILIRFQFNPTQVADKRAVTYATLNAPGMVLPARQYVQGGDRTLSFTVTVEGLTDGPIAIARDDDGSIGPELNKYRALLYPQTGDWDRARGSFVSLYAELQQFVSPPPCEFGFGDILIPCVVTDVSITEKLFNESLRPLRAEIAISLVEVAPYANAPTPPGRF